MKLRKISAVLLSMAMAVSMAGCSSGGGGNAADTGAAAESTEGAESTDGAEEEGASAASKDTYRVCFVARASADTFAAWLTSEMKAAAKVMTTSN